MAIFVSTENQAETVYSSHETGCPVGFGGSTGIPTGQPVLSSCSPTPITNRESESPIPPENRFLVDWFSCTFKLDDPNEAAEIIGLDPATFSITSFGFSGYRKSLKLGNISVYYDGREDTPS